MVIARVRRSVIKEIKRFLKKFFINYTTLKVDFTYFGVDRARSTPNAILLFPREKNLVATGLRS